MHAQDDSGNPVEVGYVLWRNFVITYVVILRKGIARKLIPLRYVLA